jgi:hypothetical protein
MAERTKATVLKTVSGATRSRVRIPVLPPSTWSLAALPATPRGSLLLPRDQSTVYSICTARIGRETPVPDLATSIVSF